MAFAGQGLLLAPGFTVTIIVAVYLSCTMNAYLASERQRGQARVAFGKYLAPA